MLCGVSNENQFVHNCLLCDIYGETTNIALEYANITFMAKDTAFATEDFALQLRIWFLQL